MPCAFKVVPEHCRFRLGGFMLQFRLFGFPVAIHWMFWLNCALIGGAIGASSPEEMQRVFAFIVAAFLSVLIHELGHASVMRYYGDRQVGIMLYALGGFAAGRRIRTRSEDFFVTAAGPFLQFSVGVAAWWLIDAWTPPNRLVAEMLYDFRYVSIFWAILNLVPVFPLDGGHILQAILGPRRVKLVLWISLVTAVALALLAFNRGLIIATLLCGMLAFNNWKQLRNEPQVPWMGAP